MNKIEEFIKILQNINLDIFHNIFYIFILMFLTFFSFKINNLIFDYLKKKKSDNNSLTSLELKKLKNKKIISIIFLLIIIGIITINDFNNFISLFTIFSFMLIIAMKEQVSNIILGLSMKFTSFTAINENDYIKIENEDFKIVKIKLFKTYLLNLKEQTIKSIPNSKLISEDIEHNALKNYNNVKFVYIFDKKILEIDLIDVEKYLKMELKKDFINIEKLKKEVGEVKFKYGCFPAIKENYNIEYKFINNNDIELTISIKRFEYDLKNYNFEYKKIYNIITNMLSNN